MKERDNSEKEETMNDLSKIVAFVSCVYLVQMAVRLPQVALVSNGKHPAIEVGVITALAAMGLIAAGVYLRFILP